MSGQNGPFAQERRARQTDPPRVAPDPVALEDRIRVARALRAVAIAGRATPNADRPASPDASRPPPLTRAPTGAAAPAPDDAAPVRPAGSFGARGAAPRPPGPARPLRIAHSLTALLALALTASLLLSPGARLSSPPSAPGPKATGPESVAPASAPQRAAAAPEAPREAADRAPPPAAAPAAADPGADPPAPPDRAEGFQAAAAPSPARAEPADPEPSGADSAGLAPRLDAGAPLPPAPAPAAALVSGASGRAPLPERVLAYVPPGADPAATEAALGALRAAGYAELADAPTALAIRRSNVRYFHAEDAAAAADLAALLAPHFPGGPVEARDFTDAPSRAAPGRLEVWIAGDAPAPPRAAATGAAASPRAVASEASEIQRLVDAVFDEPAPENAGGDVASAAGAGFERAARDIGQALRAIGGGGLRD